MKKHLLEAAERGDAEAQFNLGIIYENGLNDSRYAAEGNRPEAVRWMLAAAEQGRLAADMIAVHGMETRPTALDKRSWCGARWTADGGEVLDQSAFGITNDTRPGRHRRTQHSSLTRYRLKMTFRPPDKGS